MSDGDRHSAPYAETAGDRACRALVLDLGSLSVLDSARALSFHCNRIFCICIYTKFTQVSAETV